MPLSFGVLFRFFFFCPHVIKTYYTAIVKELLTLFEKIDFPSQIYSAPYQSCSDGESLVGGTLSLRFSSFESNVNWARKLTDCLVGN